MKKNSKHLIKIRKEPGLPTLSTPFKIALEEQPLNGLYLVLDGKVEEVLSGFEMGFK